MPSVAAARLASVRRWDGGQKREPWLSPCGSGGAQTQGGYCDANTPHRVSCQM